MKFGRFQIVLLVLLLLAAGYITGVMLPIQKMFPTIDQNKSSVSPYESISLVVNIIYSFFTLLTVIVALLKEEITKLWRKVKLQADAIEPHLFKEHLVQTSGTNSAESYSLPLNLVNSGSIDARNCRVILTRITHTNKDSGNQHNLEIKNKTVQIDSSDVQVLSPLSPVRFKIAEISVESSQGPSSPGATKSPSKPKPIMKIADNVIPQEYHKGELEIQFSIHCDGTLPKRHILKINWNGDWRNRLADICPDILKATLVVGA